MACYNWTWSYIFSSHDPSFYLRRNFVWVVSMCEIVSWRLWSHAGLGLDPRATVSGLVTGILSFVNCKKEDNINHWVVEKIRWVNVSEFHGIECATWHLLTAIITNSDVLISGQGCVFYSTIWPAKLRWTGDSSVDRKDLMWPSFCCELPHC